MTKGNMASLPYLSYRLRMGLQLEKEHRIPNTQDFLNIYKMKEKCSIDIHFHEDLNFLVR